MRRATWAVAVALALAGCGAAAPVRGDAGIDGAASDGALEGPSQDAVPPGTAFEFCIAFWEKLAATHRRCYGGVTRDWKIFAAASCDRALGTEPLAIDYDRAAADACLARIAALAPDACEAPDCLRQVIKGRLTSGQPCDRGIECGTSGLCLKSGGPACTPKTCLTYPAVGEPCQELCEDGAVCGPDRVCVPFVGRAAGEPCGGNTVSETCARDLRCRPDPTSDAGGHTCRVIADGLPCASDDDCPRQDFCDTICKPRLPLGASCAEHLTGCLVLGACAPTTKICVPGGTVGEPCGAGQFCINGWCDVRSGRSESCYPFTNPGERCVLDDNCFVGVCEGGACQTCP